MLCVSIVISTCASVSALVSKVTLFKGLKSNNSAADPVVNVPINLLPVFDAVTANSVAATPLDIK